MKQQPTAEQLAIQFSTILKEWLTLEQMQQIVSRNKETQLTNPGVCATHDFCDANMAMNEAFEKVMGREFTFNSDEEPELEEQAENDSNLFNEAWSIAKKNNFYI